MDGHDQIISQPASTSGNRKAVVSLFVAASQTSGSRHTGLFVVSFQSGSRQIQHTDAKYVMPMGVFGSLANSSLARIWSQASLIMYNTMQTSRIW
jgi:hypothetical protein